MNIVKKFKDSGATSEAKVTVDISYDIIRHVSAQLYTSPRKAIEELVCNSYDAGASECHVTVPLLTKDPLLVLDNGKSMDVHGLHGLWQVASSPKAVPDGQPRIANRRMQIGKFGVGKLAAFALGSSLTHVACVKGAVRMISVNQSQIRDKAHGRRPTFDVFNLPMSKARPLLENLLADLPKPWDRGWPTWTLAMVDNIEEGAIAQSLKIGILRRMIASALPISSKFKIFLQKDLVPLRELDPESIEVTVNVLDKAFREVLTASLREYWAERLGEAPEAIPTDLYTLQVVKVPDPENVTRRVTALHVPDLGAIFGKAVSTKTSLTTDKLEGRGYSNNGFAVTAYGKLINPEDPLFGVTQRSHKYWSRFLARVEMPGLDKVLLVQRNAVSENSPEAQLAREVLRSLFNYTRTLVEAHEDSDQYDPGSFGKRLATSSPILAQAALKGLFEGPVGPDDLLKLSIEFATLGTSGPPATLDADSRTLFVNEDHPLLAAMDHLGALSKQMRRVIGEVLGGIEVGKGYLRARRVPEIVITETSELLDASQRSAADFVRDTAEQHIAEIYDASFGGKEPFEKAVVEAFRSLRLAAHHYGKPDQPDGIIEIPRSGEGNLRISVEAKGSHGLITHKELSEATISRHSGDHACQHAIAIAREFAKAGRAGKDSALLRETKGKVPLLTVDGIAHMLRLHKRRNFTYDKIARILTTWTHPDDLVRFIEEIWRELPELGLMRLILTVAHDLITQDSTNLPEVGMILADPRIRKKKVKREDVVTVLEAVQITTRMITIIDPSAHRFELNAPVQTILEAMQVEGLSDSSH